MFYLFCRIASFESNEIASIADVLMANAFYEREAYDSQDLVCPFVIQLKFLMTGLARRSNSKDSKNQKSLVSIISEHQAKNNLKDKGGTSTQSSWDTNVNGSYKDAIRKA